MRVRPDARGPNLFHVGNRSTGVSASPGTAERALELLRKAGLEAADAARRRARAAKTGACSSDEDPERLLDVDHRYGQVVCVCEQVTAAEIAARYRCACPRARSRRAQADPGHGGPMPGSVCMAGVAFLCSLHTGQPPADLRQGPEPATIGDRSVR